MKIYPEFDSNPLFPSDSHRDEGLRFVTCVRILRDGKYWLILSVREYRLTGSMTLDNILKDWAREIYYIQHLYNPHPRTDLVDPDQTHEAERLLKGHYETKITATTPECGIG